LRAFAIVSFIGRTKECTVQNLVRVSKAEMAGLPFKPATFYAWHHKGKYPEIFISIGGALFVDKSRLEELIEAHRCSRVSGRKGKRLC
jgi:hypothetical protein